MGLFGISRELQFGICKHVSPRVSPCMARKEYSYKREKNIRKAIVNKAFMAFHWLKTCQERRGVFIVPVQLFYCHRLYRASPSLAAKYIISLTLVLTIWWCPCVESSRVVGRGCLLCVLFSWQNCYPRFILYSKAKLACYSRYVLTSYFCIPVPYDEKDIFFGVSSTMSCRSS